VAKLGLSLKDKLKKKFYMGLKDRESINQEFPDLTV